MRALCSLACVFAGISSAATAQNGDDVWERFEGTWLLENDRFQQVWDGETVETLTIPNHVTMCVRLNTAGSLLCEVSAGDVAGHILWTTNGLGEPVSHQSHFGTSRLGVGEGSVDDEGTLRLKVRFSDEPEGTFRRYIYAWDGDDRYTMMSRQYQADGTATGNWYGGSWVRAKD